MELHLRMRLIFLKFIISEACKQHVYLLDSDEIDEGDKLVFQKLKDL